MKEEEIIRRSELLVEWMARLAVAALILLLVLALCGCRTKYVTVPEWHERLALHHDTTLLHDSIHVRDSVLIVLTGDTVCREVYHVEYRDRWRERVRTDTIVRTDSVRVPVPIERKLPLWKQVIIDEFGAVMCAAVTALCILLLWLIRRRG